MLFLTLLLFLSVLTTISFKCSTPQRIGYMSYSTLVDYDNLTGLFQKIDSQLTQSQCTNLSQHSTHYNLTKIHPHIYYLDSKQKISFIDTYYANVQLGDLIITISFNYEIMYSNGSKVEGRGSTYNKLDYFRFVKALINERGKLLWKAQDLDDLVLRDPIFVHSSEPKLSFDDKLEIESVLNGLDPNCKSKQLTIQLINKIYKQDLNNWLQHEPLMTSTNILYNFTTNKSINYMNHPSQFGLNQKGMLYQFYFEVDEYTQECTKLSDVFEQKYGGHQEKIAFGQIKASVVKGLTEGWFNVDLGQSWEIDQFQYFMGDLGNYIEKAKNHTPNQQLKIKCQWDNSLYDIALQKQTQSTIYATIPYSCTFRANDVQIQKLQMNVGLQITIKATKNNLVFTIGPSAGVLSPKFTEIDGYIITSFQQATQCLKRIILSSVGTKTLGTGFPTNERGRAGVVVEQEYILIYDASQPY